MIYLLIFGLFIFGTLALVALIEYLKEVFASSHDATESLAYLIYGQGPQKLIFLHGVIGASNYFKQNLSYLEKNYTCLFIDLLGHGDSPKPRGDYSLKQHLDCIEQVLKQTGFLDDHAVLVGHSMGAVMCTHLLIKHPDKFKGAMLLNMPMFESRDEARTHVKSMSRFDGAFMAFPFVARILTYLNPVFATFPGLHKLFKVPQEVYIDGTKCPWRAMRNSLYNVVYFVNWKELTPKLSKFKILFIHSARDELAPYAKVAALCSHLPHGIFEGDDLYDHHILLRNPERVWNLLKKHFP